MEMVVLLQNHKDKQYEIKNEKIKEKRSEQVDD